MPRARPVRGPASRPGALASTPAPPTLSPGPGTTRVRTCARPNRRSPIDCVTAGFRAEFRRYQRVAESSLARLSDEAFFGEPGPDTNSAAILVKHVAGNLRSRWTDFLTTDGEKPDRDRDSEFVLVAADTRAALMEKWSAGWELLYAALDGLADADLGRDVRLRGRTIAVGTAIVMQLAHAAYHAGQIVLVARMHSGGWESLSIPRGGSAAFFRRFNNERGEA